MVIPTSIVQHSPLGNRVENPIISLHSPTIEIINKKYKKAYSESIFHADSKSRKLSSEYLHTTSEKLNMKKQIPFIESHYFIKKGCALMKLIWSCFEAKYRWKMLFLSIFKRHFVCQYPIKKEFSSV